MQTTMKYAFVVQGKPDHPQGTWDDYDTFESKVNAERAKSCMSKQLCSMAWRVVDRSKRPLQIG